MNQADPRDFFSLDSSLSDEDRLIAETVARFVDQEVLPIIDDCFRLHRFPTELIPKLAELGLLGATVDGYGCAGLGKLAYGLICRELERGDSSFRSFLSVQTSLVMRCIARFGSEEQRDRWLPAMAAGAAIGCFGLTEAHGGSDPGSMRTHAKRDGDDWIINGSKHWITNGGMSDVAIVWARGEDGVAAFLVEEGMAGFAQREITDKLSLRASMTGELSFDDVRVPDRNRLPEARSLKAALACLDEARYGIAWGVLGAAQACLSAALAHVRERKLFGSALAEKQLIQRRLANGVRALAGGQLIASRIAELDQKSSLTSAQISLAKWNNVRLALDLARDCRDMLGAEGITLAPGVMRHMLNLESVVTYEGTESIHELIVGKAITGSSAF